MNPKSTQVPKIIDFDSFSQTYQRLGLLTEIPAVPKRANYIPAAVFRGSRGRPTIVVVVIPLRHRPPPSAGAASGYKI